MSCYIDECISNSCVGIYVAIGCDIQNQKLEVYEEMIVLFAYQRLEIRDIDGYGIHTDRNACLPNLDFWFLSFLQGAPCSFAVTSSNPSQAASLLDPGPSQKWIVDNGNGCLSAPLHGSWMMVWKKVRLASRRDCRWNLCFCQTHKTNNLISQ